MFIMGWNGCVERFMFMEWLWNGYGMVMDNSGTQSLKHMALDLAVGKNGTRIREKVWCR